MKLHKYLGFCDMEDKYKDTGIGIKIIDPARWNSVLGMFYFYVSLLLLLIVIVLR